VKYILVVVCWSYAHGGAPATAEFDDSEACMFAATDMQKKLSQPIKLSVFGTTPAPGIWLVTCYPKATVR
jgi:hypothetical protein